MINSIRNYPLRTTAIGGVGILIGAGLGLGFVVPMALFVIVLLSILFAAVFKLHKTYYAGAEGIFWSGFVITFVTAFVGLFSPFHVSGLMEIWVICLAPIFISRWVLFLKLSALSWLIFGAFILSFTFGLFSAFLNDVPLKAAFYQTAYNLKLPILLVMGIAVGWSTSGEKWLVRCAILIAIYIGGWLILEIGAPSLYRSLAINLKELSYTPNPLLKGHLGRLSGPFVHSSELAFFSAFFLLFFVIRHIGQVGKGFNNIFLAIVFAIFLVLTGQQQESAAALLAIAAVYFAFKTKPALGAALFAVIGGGGTLLVILLVLGETQLAKLAGEWGMLPTTQALTSARPVFFRDAIGLANTNFPWGTGFGSFGGEGAKLFNRHLYEILGYGRYWWYQKDLFLVDTYWPNFVAETGWIATFTLFFSVLAVIVYSFNCAWRAEDALEKRTWALAFASQFIAVSISLTSPIYSDPNMVSLPFLFFGMAFTLSFYARNSEVFIKRSKCG